MSTPQRLRWEATLTCGCTVYFPESAPALDQPVCCTRHTVRVATVRPARRHEAAA